MHEDTFAEHEFTLLIDSLANVMFEHYAKERHYSEGYNIRAFHDDEQHWTLSFPYETLNVYTT